VSTVIQAILSATSDPRVRSSMALGAGLEGGSLGAGPFGVGDHGMSTGPYQINKTGGMHPDISRQQTQDPTAATAYMLGEYQGAVARVPSSLWASDPEAAAERAAYLAERPAQDYVTARGQDAVNTAYSNGQAALSAGHALGGGGGSSLSAADLLDPFGFLPGHGQGLFEQAGGALSGAAADAAGGAVSAAVGPLLSGLGHIVLTGGAVLVGGALVVAGLSRAVSKSGPAQAAKQTAAPAIAAAPLLLA
jgi:hypothetical protein